MGDVTVDVVRGVEVVRGVDGGAAAVTEGGTAGAEEVEGADVEALSAAVLLAAKDSSDFSFFLAASFFLFSVFLDISSGIPSKN